MQGKKVQLKKDFADLKQGQQAVVHKLGYGNRYLLETEEGFHRNVNRDLLESAAVLPLTSAELDIAKENSGVRIIQSYNLKPRHTVVITTKTICSDQ